MKIYWANDQFKTGAAFGFSVHNRRLKEALIDIGVEITTDPSTPHDVAVGVGEPESFKSLPRTAPRVYFTNAESDVQKWLTEDIDAEALVVSCTYAAEVTKKYFSGPVEVCPLGVDTSVFKPLNRTHPGPKKTFWYLYVDNIQNVSKGVEGLLFAWNAWGESGRRPPNAWLHIKGSGRRGGNRGTFSGFPNVVFDQQLYSTEELAGLYRQAHCHIKPSFGEGFGFSTFEAIATGCPSIWGHHTAALDYLDAECGFPVSDFEMVPTWLFDPHEGVTNPMGMIGPSPEVMSREPSCYMPKIRQDALIETMDHVFRNYARATFLGKKGAAKVKKLTWEASARRFLEICEGVAK